ncbi:ASCH domain-containing protein [Salimicrobium jeotgali]|uniref:ASCH domain-containing protein n=1 Tax=Salimicrobium jeotgali TaxID=1230341 RepID=UPI000C8453C4|nr:ASCH domain-containing protein [Salimicrobium jeotgali]
MNEKAGHYWKDYWKGVQAPENVSAWSFGTDEDELAGLVVRGIKTATCSLYEEYVAENDPLPEEGEYSIVLDSNEEPAAIIRTNKVTIMPMNEVPESFAFREGEGDRSYTYWWNAHEKFFRPLMEELGKEFTEDTAVVCEEFELIDARDR